MEMEVKVNEVKVKEMVKEEEKEEEKDSFR